MGDDSKKGRDKKNGIILILIILLAAGIIGGLAGVRAWMEGQQEPVETSVPQTEEINTKPETQPETETETEAETEAPYVSPIDFETLWQQNPDTVGWVRIPDTMIDYPIVHDPEDNEHYLHTDFDGNKSVYGTIYLDCDSEPDFSGRNNPIYGHHMKDGSMFKGLEYFKKEDYFKEHQYFDIYTPERTIHLKAVACYYSSADGIVRQTSFQTQEDFDQWVKGRLEKCSFAEMPEGPVESMFVLVTCSYEMPNARTLLFAVEVEEEES